MKILIATNNPAKVREIQAVLAAAAFSPAHLSPHLLNCSTLSSLTPSPSLQWASLSELPSPIPEPEETGTTFLENATLKATYYARTSGMLALADDSGLEVDALAGEPGVHSAYFDRTAAHLPRPQRDAANNAKLVAAMSGLPLERRTARYHCVMVLASPTSSPASVDGILATAHGNVRVLATAHGVFEGLIIDEPRGAGGFGYDPYFLIPDLQKTAAELPAEHKNRISHRGKALNAMREKILGLLNSGE
ncbi:hypothetical protein B7486_07195 [cyanobacterium TDX16]|nr:hypothetical protein B7486_07195 [cyanobacterium TDX16]